MILLLKYWLHGVALIIGLCVGWLAGNYVGYGNGQDEGRQQGFYLAQEAIRKQDAKSVEAARSAINELDKCYDLGGTWDQSRGLCELGDETAR